METIAIHNEGASIIHLEIPISFYLCYGMMCHYYGWICFMEPYLNSDVYVHTLCICIRPRSGVIKIIFVFYYNCIMKMQYYYGLVQIVGDMESTGNGDSDNTTKKQSNNGDGQYKTAGSNTTTMVKDRTSPLHSTLD